MSNEINWQVLLRTAINLENGGRKGLGKQFLFLWAPGGSPELTDKSSF